MAAVCGGKFLLRIEDIDTTRSRPQYERAIVEDLRWLGLAWEEPVRRQSQHLDEYQALLDRLRELELVYPAFLSRREIVARIAEAEAAGRQWPRDPDGAPLYPGSDRSFSATERSRRLADGQPFTWRLDMAEALRRLDRPLSWLEWANEAMERTRSVAADPAAWGDVVVARRDTPTSYHLSVVADDARQGITDVVRGRDLFAATSVHRLLQELLDLGRPTYFHHRLVLGADGRKLSKSEGARGLRALRSAGATPAGIYAMIG